MSVCLGYRDQIDVCLVTMIIVEMKTFKKLKLQYPDIRNSQGTCAIQEAF